MSEPLPSGWRASTPLGLGIVAAALILASNDRPPEDDPQAAAETRQPPAEQVDVADRLPGTWMREQVEQGVRSRKLLRLEPDGMFQEQVRIESASGAVSEHHHAGTWLYDGTNLKRKYTLMNGSAPSRLRLPFATFEIRFETRNEFVGVDHIHRNIVRYRRVQPETQL
jgi:hypothetical protein